MGGGSCSRDCGFKSQHRMDVFHTNLLFKLSCLFEKTENKRKRGRDCPLKTFERRRTPFHFSDPTHPPKITPHVHHQRLFPHN